MSDAGGTPEQLGPLAASAISASLRAASPDAAVRNKISEERNKGDRGSEP